MHEELTDRSPARFAGVAACALSACAVHCAIMPFAVGLLPLVGLGFFASHAFEWSMLGAAALLGGAGLSVSYARAHRDARPFAVFLAGLGIVVGAHLLLNQSDVLHAGAAVGGALLMYVAGRMNHDCAAHAAH